MALGERLQNLSDFLNSPPAQPTSAAPEQTLRFLPRHAPISERSRNFCIELVSDGPKLCELCEKPCGFPFSGFFLLEDGERIPVCELCLVDESIFLGLLLTGAAMWRKVGSVRTAGERRALAGELASFGQLFDAVLTQSFGAAAEPSQLLEHLARLGKARLAHPPSTPS